MPPFRRLLRWALIAFVAASLLGLLALGTVYFVVSSRLPDVQSLRTVELQDPLYVIETGIRIDETVRVRLVRGELGA